MIDFGSGAMLAVAQQQPAAYGLVFLAGLAGSAGPCVAPRFVAAAGLAAGTSPLHARTRVAAMIAGLVAAYACFGCFASLIGVAAAFSPAIYALAGAAMLFCGIRTLVREPVHGSPRCSAARPGGAFFLGASFALVVSPCCTPAVLGILAYASASGAQRAPLLLACYALGHAVPLGFAAMGSAALRGVFARADIGRGIDVLGAALSVALGMYYMVMT
ncbi:MAG: cytochrome c biogenesis CcdA family protein [Candidatus Baltobacteraceae bacterium]